MDYFFTLLKKSLVLTVFIIFGFVATYIPQPYNQVETVEAGGMTGGSTEPTQILNQIQLGFVNIAATASAAYDKISAFASNNLAIKELQLDGIGWAIAKGIVSSMVQSIISWINSGFQGSPAFVTNLEGFLINAADKAVGEYIADLGALGSFICSPFRLDVQISVALQYDRIRGNGQPAPTCTLSGVLSNLEGFISGDFTQGGWEGWFDITATPETYTPYGSVLAAQSGARARIINAQGEELKLLDFGDGFLSGEICEVVHGAASPREECFISKPGKIIEEALSFNLDTGRQSLIEADEINEVISALLGQLANTALTGAAGLLGLSGGTGHTYSGFNGGSYINQLQAEGTGGINPAESRALLTDSLADQQRLEALIRTYQPALLAYGSNPTVHAQRRAGAIDAYNETFDLQTDVAISIPALQNMIIKFDAAVLAEDFDTQAAIMSDYITLVLYAEASIDAYESKWKTTLR